MFYCNKYNIFNDAKVYKNNCEKHSLIFSTFVLPDFKYFWILNNVMVKDNYWLQFYIFFLML